MRLRTSMMIEDRSELVRKRAGFIIPMLSSPISVIASILIIVMILRSKKRLSIVYHRLLFGLSVADIFVSFAMTFSSLPAPKHGSDQTWIALGNNFTCTSQGFLYMLGATAEPIYSVSLQVYYLCMIKYSLSTEYIEKKIEPFLHVIPILYGITSAITAMSIGSINATTTWCWIQSYPFECHRDPEVTCDRGENTNMMRWVFLGGPYIFILFFTGIVMWMIYTAVKKRESAMARHSFIPSIPAVHQIEHKRSPYVSTETTLSLNPPSYEIGQRSSLLSRISLLSRYSLLSRASTANISPDRPVQEVSQRVNTRKTATRVFQYSMGFLLTYIIPIISTAISTYSSTVIFLEILTLILYPLQGLYNFVIFILPHFSKVRAKNEEISFVQVLSLTVQSYGRPDESNDHEHTTNPSNINNNRQIRKIGEVTFSNSHATGGDKNKDGSYMNNNKVIINEKNVNTMPMGSNNGIDYSLFPICLKESAPHDITSPSKITFPDLTESLTKNDLKSTKRLSQISALTTGSMSYNVGDDILDDADAFVDDKPPV